MDSSIQGCTITSPLCAPSCKKSVLPFNDFAVEHYSDECEGSNVVHSAHHRY